MWQIFAQFERVFSVDICEYNFSDDWNYFLGRLHFDNGFELISTCVYSCLHWRLDSLFRLALDFFLLLLFSSEMRFDIFFQFLDGSTFHFRLQTMGLLFVRPLKDGLLQVDDLSIDLPVILNHANAEESSVINKEYVLLFIGGDILIKLRQILEIAKGVGFVKFCLLEALRVFGLNGHERKGVVFLSVNCAAVVEVDRMGGRGERQLTITHRCLRAKAIQKTIYLVIWL